MASGFFAMFDDVAMLLDDIAAMSKIATKKTAGILGDDLAVNAQKASGFASARELPVLWAITKGSFINKLIILPVIFLLSAFASWLIIPILMIGGIYLAYEGAEKIYEYFNPPKKIKDRLPLTLSKEEILKHERSKIKSAITTDFILSIEIIIIALGTVLDKSMLVQIAVVSIIAIVATIGVYGIVALIVRMDDLGYRLLEIDGGKSKIANNVGTMLIKALPKVIRSLTVIGTLAMLLVAGGIYTHNVHQIGEFLEFLPSMLRDLFIGLIIGFIAVGFMKIFMKMTGKTD